MIPPDLLWKMVLRVLHREAIEFFFPQAQTELDFDIPIETLDKELQKIYPKSTSKNRIADLLLKATLKNGADKFLLIHFEAQGYEDATLPDRMMQMRNRIHERYGGEPVAVVIYTGESSERLSTRYLVEKWGTTVMYEWVTYKILEHPPHTLPQNGNIFAIVMELAYHRLRQGKLNDQKLEQLKIGLIRRLLMENIEREKIKALIMFIDSYVSFGSETFQIKFETTVSQIFQKNRKMDVIEEVIREIKKQARKQARIEGRMEGRLEGRLEGRMEGKVEGKLEVLTVTLPLMLNAGMTPEQIATDLDIELTLVQKLMSNLPSMN